MKEVTKSPFTDMDHILMYRMLTNIDWPEERVYLFYDLMRLVERQHGYFGVAA